MARPVCVDGNGAPGLACGTCHHAANFGAAGGGPETWAGNQNEAMGFKNSIAALEFCVAHKIHEVEILLIAPQLGLPLRLFPRESIGAGVGALERPPKAPFPEAIC